MIITRTPFRISFFGGGTDYPIWYKENGGAVLATTINKYCYITLRYLPPFFEHRSRVIYSRIEHVNNVSEIQHPAVRECLRYLKIKKGVEIHHDGDLPARSGMGSSSSFAVGLLHALYALKGKIMLKSQLAKEAIHIERDILKENVGSQDQVAVAFGGFNKIIFSQDGNFRVEPITLSKEKVQRLQDYLMLIYTGKIHSASNIARYQIKNTPNKKKELSILHQMVDEAIDIINGERDILEFGKLLHEAWQIKKSLSHKISNVHIDNIYDRALSAGAVGGKLLGAGNGGFMLLFVPPDNLKKVKESLKGLLEVKFSFENEGSQIIYYSAQ